MAEENPLNKPFHVRTLEGVFHSGWDEESQAEARAKKANADAEELGIPTRYEVKPKAA